MKTLFLTRPGSGSEMLCLRSRQADREGGAGPPGEGVCTGRINLVGT